eukprot:scaffold54171_cov69-Phaeocystis_antarctica.AAC.6
MLEGGAHVGVGEVERAPCIVAALAEESAVRSYAVQRRVHTAQAVESGELRGGLQLHALRAGGVVVRGVPAGASVAIAVHEEDVHLRLHRCRRRHLEWWQRSDGWADGRLRVLLGRHQPRQQYRALAR